MSFEGFQVNERRPVKIEERLRNLNLGEQSGLWRLAQAPVRSCGVCLALNLSALRLDRPPVLCVSHQGDRPVQEDVVVSISQQIDLPVSIDSGGS